MDFKKLISPQALPFDYEEWQQKPFAERATMLCQAWAVQGYGAPVSVYLFYLLKIAAYVGLWGWFCSFSDALGSLAEVSQWWAHPEAVCKAVLWSMLFESLGLGCGSGPLTARYFPPFGAVFHYLRPGTIRLPLFPNLYRNNRRNLFDVLLYIVFAGSLLFALTSSAITPAVILPVVIMLPLLTFLDKTMFISARGEHYWVVLLCFLFPTDAVAGSKLVWIAIWMWAATSKLNRHFPSVIGVMVSNSALIRLPWIRKKMYINYPDDLRASRLSKMLAHSGTVIEYIFPLMLLFGDGGTTTIIALSIMFVFHLYITGSVPMAVPLEWNVIMVYGGFVLFGAHADVWAFSVQALPLIIALAVMLVGMPILGNLFPQWVSFLVSMRYYAGNWAYSVWLFKKGCEEKLDDHIVKCADTVEKQLRIFYDERTAHTLLSKVIAFRSMHLHGRILQDLIPQLTDNIDDYVWRDGELVAGVVLGWNFGDGHIHNEQLLEAVQQRCQFASGELRCLFVEAQPVFKPYMEWRMWDARDGLLQSGRSIVKTLEEKQPWAGSGKR